MLKSPSLAAHAEKMRRRGEPQEPKTKDYKTGPESKIPKSVLARLSMINDPHRRGAAVRKAASVIGVCRETVYRQLAQYEKNHVLNPIYFNGGSTWNLMIAFTTYGIVSDGNRHIRPKGAA